MSKPLIATAPVSAAAGMAARISIFSVVVFVLLLGTLHVLEPEFDPTWRFISEYALGDWGWMMHLAFLALAVSLGAASLALWSQARTIVGYVGLIGLWIAAAGILLAAIFTTDPITASQSAETFSGKMHVLGAALDWTPIAALLLSFSLARNVAWQSAKVWLFVTSGIMLALMITFTILLPRNGHFGPGVYAGLFGRFLLVSYLGWLLVAGIHTIKLRRKAQLGSTPQPPLQPSA